MDEPDFFDPAFQAESPQANLLRLLRATPVAWRPFWPENHADEIAIGVLLNVGGAQVRETASGAEARLTVDGERWKRLLSASPDKATQANGLVLKILWERTPAKPEPAPSSISDDDPEARWARWERSEHGSDSETKLWFLWERWKLAKDDTARRRDVVRRSALWLLEELRECARLGRSFLIALPSDLPPALSVEGLPGPYAAAFGLYAWRVDECLRRAVAMAKHCRDGMAMELGRAAFLAHENYQAASGFLSSHSPIIAARLGIEYLERAESVLTGAFRAESEPPEFVPFSGIPIDPPAPETSSPAPEATAEPSAPSGTAGELLEAPSGLPLPQMDKQGRRFIVVNRQKVYEPAPWASKAYELATRLGWTQSRIAREIENIERIPCNQSKVSRELSKYRAWFVLDRNSEDSMQP